MDQARELGIPEGHVLQTSGMILNPKFYAPLNLNRRVERMRRGLRVDLPTGVVLFGGEGSHEMLRIAKALNREGSGVQLIFLCGKNEALAERLRAIDQRIPMSCRASHKTSPIHGNGGFLHRQAGARQLTTCDTTGTSFRRRGRKSRHSSENMVCPWKHTPAAKPRTAFESCHKKAGFSSSSPVPVAQLRITGGYNPFAI